MSDKAGVERRYARFSVAQSRSRPMGSMFVSETAEDDKGQNSSHGDGYDSNDLSLTCWPNVWRE